MTPRILLVEDDEDLARGPRFNLEQEGYRFERAASAAEARTRMAGAGFDLVLLDLSLPDGDGLDLLRALRASDAATPVICLTARGTESDIVMGLKLGADDYVAKPFGLAQLLARIAAVLRRSSPSDGKRADDRLSLGAVVIDFEARVASRGGRTEELTPIEVDLLRYLGARRGSAVERKDLLRDLWGVDRTMTTRTLDNHVARLRKKIEADPASPAWLVTVHGVGYRLEMA